MVGIYKITNPKGKVYIGQSINIERRFKTYSRVNCKNQTLIYNSISKYGWENHKFEIIEECLIENLDKRENYWGKYYNTLEEGLNLRLGNGRGTCSKETKQKMSNSQKGIPKPKPEEFGEEVIKRLKGKKQSLKTIQKRVKKNKGQKRSLEQRKKISEGRKGWVPSEERNSKISKANKGRKVSQSNISKRVPQLLKPILQYDKNNNFIKEWNSQKEAGEYYGSSSTISNALKQRRCKTAYGFVWKYK